MKRKVLLLGVVLVLGAAQFAAGKSVTGVIRQPGGAPAIGVRVAAVVVPGAGRGGPNGPSVLATSTKTDTNGRYLLEDLPPGRYFIAAGLVDSFTFYPGTAAQNDARVITITQDEPGISGIDFALTPDAVKPVQPAPNPPPGVPAPRPCCNLSGLILSEDGKPLPAVPLKVVDPRNNLSVAVEDGLFRFFLSQGTTAQFGVEGLLPGYSLRSIVYGGQNAGSGGLVIDGRAPSSLLFLISADPGSTLPKVRASGKVLNIAREINATNLSLVLSSTISNETSVVAPVRPDSSFEFLSIPVGSYQAAVRDPAGHAWPTPSVFVITKAISDLKIDFGNDPFPDLASSGLGPTIFTNGKEITITGVVTERFTRLRATGVYFRMNAKDENGVITPWAVYVSNTEFAPNIAIGKIYTVPGTAVADGTHRLKAKPF